MCGNFYFFIGKLYGYNKINLKRLSTARIFTELITANIPFKPKYVIETKQGEAQRLAKIYSSINLVEVKTIVEN